LRGLRVPVATVVDTVADGTAARISFGPCPTASARTFAKRFATPAKRSASGSYRSQVSERLRSSTRRCHARGRRASAVLAPAGYAAKASRRWGA
jgi:hypothetical protein